MADLQWIADRLEIQDLLVRYARALDTKDFDVLDTVFTPDAHLDYTSSGGIAGRYPEVKAWLSKVLRYFPVYQHLVANHDVEIDGDRATSVASLYNPMQRGDGGGMFYVGAEYRDRLVRTPAGWRIEDRYEHLVWMDGNVPDVPDVATP